MMMRMMGAAVVGMLLMSTAVAGDNEWLTDLSKAKEAAAGRKVAIFAFFTGSDWCPWCVKLHKEVLSTEEFKAYAKESLVLFEADFPKKKMLPEEVKTQNEALSEKYAIKGFPSVLLLDSDGKEIGRTGYRPGGAAKYIEEIKSLLAFKAPTK